MKLALVMMNDSRDRKQITWLRKIKERTAMKQNDKENELVISHNLCADINSNMLDKRSA